MSLAKIIWIVSLLAAVALSFVSTGHNGLIFAALGLASGWFCSSDDRRGVLIAAAFLYVGGASSLGAIPGVGGMLNNMLGGLGAVFGAAGAMIVVRTLVERILPTK